MPYGIFSFFLFFILARAGLHIYALARVHQLTLLISAIYIFNNQRRREGEGERRNVPPPPEIGKIVVEIWFYLPEVYTFGAESEIQEIFSKKLWKKSIFHWDFNQKISKFSWKFSKISWFLVQTRNVLQAWCLVNRNHSSDLDDIAFFYKFQSIFSKNFNFQFSCHFQ